MCGGCGRSDIGDWLTPAVRTLQARERAARAVNELSGGPVRVVAGSVGFVVRFPTGRAVMAPTLSAVWAELPNQRPVSFENTPTTPTSVATVSATAPEVPQGRLAVAVTERPEQAQLLAEVWQAGRVLRWSTGTPLEDVVAALSGHDRVLVAVRPDDSAAGLALVTQPVLRLRAVVTAFVREAHGPAWATAIGRLDPSQIRAVLGGCSPTTAAHPGMGLPEAAAWVGGLVKSGATQDRRVTVSVDGGRWLLDTAHGHGVAVRPTREDVAAPQTREARTAGR